MPPLQVGVNPARLQSAVRSSGDNCLQTLKALERAAIRFLEVRIDTATYRPASLDRIELVAAIVTLLGEIDAVKKQLRRRKGGES